MSDQPTKEQLLDDYRARQIATVLSVHGEVIAQDESEDAETEITTPADADGCVLDASLTYALQIDYSPVQIEIRHGVPREAAAALLRKAADWIEQEGDRLMDLSFGQTARRIPPGSEWSDDLIEE